MKEKIKKKFPQLKRKVRASFKNLLFWATRPLARVFLYTGSLKFHLKKNLKSVRAKRLALVQLGGTTLSLETEDDRKIDAMYFDSQKSKNRIQKFDPNNRPTVIYCLGNSLLFENCGNMIRFYLDRDVNVFVFNYGGYGKSEGSPTVKTTYHDVEAAYKYVTTVLNVPDERIIVHGFSMGGGPATYLASKHPIDLVLDRTYSRIGHVIGGVLGTITNYLYPYDNISKIQYIRGNIHIVEATKDEIMSRHHVNDLFNEIVRVRHRDALGKDLGKLRKEYITEIESGHTDCWLTDILGIYTAERRKFEKKVLESAQPKEKSEEKETFFQKIWKKLKKILYN